jgi:hypothetical protein
MSCKKECGHSGSLAQVKDAFEMALRNKILVNSDTNRRSHDHMATWKIAAGALLKATGRVCGTGRHGSVKHMFMCISGVELSLLCPLFQMSQLADRDELQRLM